MHPDIGIKHSCIKTGEGDSTLLCEQPLAESSAANPQSAVAPREFPRSAMRRIGNPKVEIGTVGTHSDLGKISLDNLRALGNSYCAT